MTGGAMGGISYTVYCQYPKDQSLLMNTFMNSFKGVIVGGIAGGLITATGAVWIPVGLYLGFTTVVVTALCLPIVAIKKYRD